MARVGCLLLCLVGAGAAGADELRNISAGVGLDFGYGSSARGDTLMGELGGEFVGIRSFCQRGLLVQWDLLAVVRGGILGNEVPYMPLLGVHAAADVEVGRRWMPDKRWSGYHGFGAGGDLQILTKPGVSLNDLKQYNNVDGVAGAVARGTLRAAVGASFLDGDRSLIITAFFQEDGRTPGYYTPGIGFSEGGVAVRFDMARSWTVQLHALGGAAPATSTPALATTDQTAYAEVAGVVRKIFKNRMWLALSGQFSRQLDHRTYTNMTTNTAYYTADAPTFGVSLFYGISLEPRR